MTSISLETEGAAILNFALDGTGYTVKSVVPSEYGPMVATYGKAGEDALYAVGWGYADILNTIEAVMECREKARDYRRRKYVRGTDNGRVRPVSNQ